MALISVIIPYFKNKKYISRALRSVIQQSYKNFEIIIIFDNDSNDELNYIKNLKKIDNRIKLIINNKNIGAGLSRNKAIKASKGKYIAFLDSDDTWHPKKLKIQLTHMLKNKILISHTSYKIINKKNKIIGFRKAKKLEYSQLIKSCDIGLSTVMIVKELLIKDQFAKLKTKEDYVLWLKLAKKKNVFYPIKNYLTKWRKLDNSLSSSIKQKLLDGYTVYRVYLGQSIIKSLISLLNLSINYIKK